MSEAPPHIKEERETSPQPSRSDPDDQPHQRQRAFPTGQQSPQQSTSKDREPMTGFVLPPISSLHTAAPSPQPTERYRPGSIAAITSPIDAPLPPIPGTTTTTSRRIPADQRWAPYDTTRRFTTVQDSRRRSDSASSLRSSSVQISGPLMLKSVTAPPLLPGLPSSDSYADRRASSGSTAVPSMLRSAYARPPEFRLDTIKPPLDQGLRRPSTFHSQVHSRHASVVSSTSSISGIISTGPVQLPPPIHQTTPTRTTETHGRLPTMLYAPHQPSTSPPSHTPSVHSSFSSQPILQPPTSISSRIPISIDTLHASYSADEKRKRNAGASARFRARRREREHTSSQAIDELRQRLVEAEREAETLRRERDELLVILQRGVGGDVADADASVNRDADVKRDVGGDEDKDRNEIGDAGGEEGQRRRA